VNPWLRIPRLRAGVPECHPKAAVEDRRGPIPSKAMSPVGWIVFAAICLPFVGLSVLYIGLLRNPTLGLSDNVRFFIAMRVTELILFVLILAAAVLTTRWVLVAEVVPLVLLPLARRQVKRRELSTGQ
jgi:hypothetical protein